MRFERSPSRSRRRIVWGRVTLCGLVVSAACGSERPATRDTVAASVRDSQMPTGAAMSGSGCRLTGAWQSCSVEDRLKRAGLIVVRRDDSPTIDFLGVPGTVYAVGAGEDRVEVFIWPDASERLRATEALDSVAVAPRGTRRPYRVQPLLVTSNNLAAVIFTVNPRTSERLELALSAGLPPTRP